MHKCLFWTTLFVAFCSGCTHHTQPKPPALAASIQTFGCEHNIYRDRIRLSVWEKTTWNCHEHEDKPRPLIVLVHGASYSSRPDFDLPIRDYSLMDAFARAGFDVFALDVHGYGHSDKSASDMSDTDSAVQDLSTALDYILRLKGGKQASLFGWSWGSQITGRYAAQNPTKVSRLVLFAPFFMGPMEWQSKSLPDAPRHPNIPADMSDFIPGQYDTDVVAIYKQSIEVTDPSSPNGVWIDLRTKLPLLNPRKISVPTLIIHGELDPISTTQDLAPFFSSLAASEKSYVVLPHGGHAIFLEKNRRLFQKTVLNFLKAQPTSGSET